MAIKKAQQIEVGTSFKQLQKQTSRKSPSRIKTFFCICSLSYCKVITHFQMVNWSKHHLCDRD